MAVRLDVAATVVDVRGDTPASNDLFYVDTNVWYWTTYDRCTLARNPPLTYQIASYPRYVFAGLAVGATLLSSGLAVSEIAFAIERSEHELFVQRSGNKTTRKEFRHNFPSTRRQVAEEIQDAWSLVRAYSTLMDVTVSGDIVDNAINRMSTELLDGYDAIVVEMLSTIDCTQVITDDADFATVPGITVFTANNTVLRAAARQGKLVAR